MRHTGGWIKLHRKILEHWIMKDPNAFLIFNTLLMWANRKQSKYVECNEIRTVDKGQVLTSLRQIADFTGIDRRTVNRKLKLLSKDSMILQKAGHLGTVITICNYVDYQDQKQDMVPHHVPHMVPHDVPHMVPHMVPHDVPIVEKERSKEVKEEKNHVTTSPMTCDEKIGIPKKKKYNFSDWDLKTAKTLQETIAYVNPDAVRVHKANLDQWANDFRLIREVDKIPCEKIERVCDWVFRNDFWKSNIQSPAKLRKKWDTLTGQMKRPKEMSNAELSEEAARLAMQPTDEHEISF